jgi:hypothetical protein
MTTVLWNLEALEVSEAQARALVGARIAYDPYCEPDGTPVPYDGLDTTDLPPPLAILYPCDDETADPLATVARWLEAAG